MCKYFTHHTAGQVIKVLMFTSVLSIAISIVTQVLQGFLPIFGTGSTVQLSYGSFQGFNDGVTTSFLGMPFARPPLGKLRFAPPQPPLNFRGVRTAFTYGAACPQQLVEPPTIPGVDLNFTIPWMTINHEASEDCLFINVVKPSLIPPGKNLPVVFWMYGGGFEIGDTSLDPGHPVVERSIALGVPIIHVSANYRLNAFGFLPGKEAKAAGIGNAGLRDQRFALEWVQENIHAFGGDRTKVTIWGESAGSVSVGLHMVVNNGDHAGLFRGAFMESGSPLPLNDITAGQPLYDQLVANSGCVGAADTLACLRSVPFDVLQTAVNRSPNKLSYRSLVAGWQPSIDGEFLRRNPQDSLAQGLYAKVPFVTGNCEDEGTLFSFSTLNITTNEEFLDYVANVYLVGATESDIAAVGNAYPDDITKGSPFHTGISNALTPEFKRLAAFQGDVVFQAPRRFFLQTASKTQDTWAFLYKRGKTTPFLGAVHASDIPEFYGSSRLADFVGTDALVNFANTLNPTTPFNFLSLLSTVHWHTWGSSTTAPPMLAFFDPAPAIVTMADDYRVEAIDLLVNISRKIVH